MVLGGPMAHVMAAKAVALAEARRPEFADYARRTVENAAALADGLQRRGARVVTGGTENHLVLLDVAGSFGLTGRQAESALVESGVVTNRNSIPADPNGAWYTSGVRLGTPALTTLGLGSAELDEVADIIVGVLRATTPTSTKSGAPSQARYTLDATVADASRTRCADLLARFPLYPTIDLTGAV
jgi:glycine hydroxymethyltransferase